MRFLLLIPILALAACSAGVQPDNMTERRATVSPSALPPMKRFTDANISPPTRSNTEIARDFLDLSFNLETGRTLPVMTRFVGPITLRVIGAPPASLEPDLAHLLNRLRREAGIPIRRVDASLPANITIDVIPREELQRFVPKAACFVVPRTSSWAQYRNRLFGNKTDWATLTVRNQIAIFLPGDVSPQGVRDCLHEELAQALGPLNDLFRLSDSVFNDDDFHTVLTGFDMLILRAYYAPEMHNGMTRSQAAITLPDVLARLNPRGQHISTTPMSRPTPQAWTIAIAKANGRTGTAASRRRAARNAVNIARNYGWNDTRLGFSLYTLGRLSVTNKNAGALNIFRDAYAVYNHKETRVHAANVTKQLAFYALSTGDGKRALELVNASLPAIADSKDAKTLATLLMIKAEALELVGRSSEAHAVRLDSLGWARYGFGSDEAVRNRLARISALTPIRMPDSMRDL